MQVTDRTRKVTINMIGYYYHMEKPKRYEKRIRTKRYLKITKTGRNTT